MLIHQIFKDKASTKDLQKTMEVLHESIKKWPHNPIFRNYLFNAYLLVDDQKKLKRVFKGATTQTIRIRDDKAGNGGS